MPAWYTSTAATSTIAIRIRVPSIYDMAALPRFTATYAGVP